MALFIIGIICVLGSVGGFECAGSWVTFLVTLAIGVACIIRGVSQINS